MEFTTTARTLIRLVEIAVVFEDGVAKIVPIEWRHGMTVLAGLKSASKKPHGISFQATGHGRNAFITEIDGQANDTTGSWKYWVNGEWATVGCGEYVLKAGDFIRWEFVPNDPTAR